MSNIHPGLVLAFIAGCVGLFPAVHGAEGLWQANFDKSTAIRGGYVPGYGESWLCKYTDVKGLVRVGAFFTSNPGCEVHKDKLDNIFESIPIIKDLDKVQFLSTDGGTHSYAWIRGQDVRSLQGAISAGGGGVYEKTYVCRATYFIPPPPIGMLGGRPRLEVYPGTYYPSKGECVIPNPYQNVPHFDILFDLYSMCDNNANSEYKKGTWSPTFDQTSAVEAGVEANPGEISYVCRVQRDSRQILGKHTTMGPSCGYPVGENVEYSGTGPQEVLVSTPSNFYAWSPRRDGNVGDGAIEGAAAPDGSAIYICRALADIDGYLAPRSPGSVKPSEGVCTTVIEGRVARNPKYEVLVDMRRTCDGRNRGALRSTGAGTPWGTVVSSPRFITPIDPIKSRSGDSGSSNADVDDYLAMGFSAVKHALDAYASA